MTMAVVAIAVGLAAGTLWAGVNSASASASEVRLEPTASAGPNPFMAPVGQDRAGVTPVAATGGEFAGDTPGLFAETTDKPSCDTRTLAANLAADVTKSAAWADALNMQAEDIPSYVDTLNPVLLRSDTAVTSHGYQNGAYVPYPAVLQAGTSVFVNSFGEPTVKCFSGNPLTRPTDFAQASYVGPRWGYFAPEAVTYVKPTVIVIKNYTYVDIDRGGWHQKRSWCDKHSDSKHCKGPNPDRWCDKHPDSDKCKHRKKDEPKNEEPKNDEPKNEEPKNNEPKVEVIKNVPVVPAPVQPAPVQSGPATAGPAQAGSGKRLQTQQGATQQKSGKSEKSGKGEKKSDEAGR